MADSVAVVALGVRISTSIQQKESALNIDHQSKSSQQLPAISLFFYLRRSPGFTRVEAITSLRPLDADVESLKVLSIELLLGVLSRLVRLVLDKCVRSLKTDRVKIY